MAKKGERQNWWSGEEDAILRPAIRANLSVPKMVVALQKMGFYRTESGILGRIDTLLGTPKELPPSPRKGVFYTRRTEAEKAYIREQFMAFVPREEILRGLNKKFGLHLSLGSLNQYIHHKGLKRDARKAMLAKRFGADVLKRGDDPVALRAELQAEALAEKEARKAAHKDEIKQVLQRMLVDLSSGVVPRWEAMQQAMLHGATLQDIGDAVGVTRERVRQIVNKVKPNKYYKPKPPRDMICQGCGSDYQVTGRGRSRQLFCNQCRKLPASARPVNRERLITNLLMKMPGKEARDLVEGLLQQLRDKT